MVETFYGKRVEAKDAETLVEMWKKEFGDAIVNIEIRKKTAGVQRKMEYSSIWIEVQREFFHSFVRAMTREQVPHLAVASGYDNGDEIVLTYHFSLYYGIKYSEIPINVRVRLPKSDPTIDTITDIIPGALITEREKMEMLGVKVKDIPDPRRVFTSDDLGDYYPWRRDNDPEKEKRYVKNLSEVGL